MTNLKTAFEIQQIQSIEEFSAIDSLAVLYQKLFADPPSCHSTSLGKIKEMFFQNCQKGGKVLVALSQQKLVGFSATVPFTKSFIFGSEAVDNVGRKVVIDEDYCYAHLGINPASIWYLADIGTHPDYRCLGIATQLFQTTRSLLLSDTPIFLRVAQAKENATRLYQSWGFQLLGLSQHPLYKKLNGNLESEPKHIMLYVPQQD